MRPSALGLMMLATGTTTQAAVRYTITDLGVISGSSSSSRDINASGQVAGQSDVGNGSGEHAFLYSGGVISDLGALGALGDGSEFYLSDGNSINASGQVAGYSVGFDGLRRAVLFSNGTVTDLGTLGGAESTAYGINDAGDVTGLADTAVGGPRAFVYSGGVMTSLGTFAGGRYSWGEGIKNSGQVTGFAALPGTPGVDEYRRAFRYSAGVLTELGTLGGFESFGRDINASGQIAGDSTLVGYAVQHAFLDTDGVITTASPALASE